MPTSKLAALAVFTRLSCGAAKTLSLSVALLLALVGSVEPIGGATLAPLTATWAAAGNVALIATHNAVNGSADSAPYWLGLIRCPRASAPTPRPWQPAAGPR